MEKDGMIDSIRRKLFDEYPSVRRLGRKLVAVVPLSIRLGKRFWDWYSFFEESEAWDDQQMREFQVTQLRNLLSELAATSSFYRDRLGALGVNQFDSLHHFSAIVPTLTKTEFKNHFDQILSSSRRDQKLAKFQTSGTTGLALQFYHAADDWAREWAAICHQWKRVGYFPGTSRRAEFRALTAPGRIVEEFPQDNMIRCSILDFTKKNIVHYGSEIRMNRIDFYHGYPSALHILAREINHGGLVFPQPKAVLLASEQIYQWQLDEIEKAFPAAKIFAHYGCAERTILAAWCEHRREYHVLPQYAFVETVDNTSEVVGTNLYNTVNGFVRYRMTDTVLKTDQSPCPDCGRPYVPRLIELGGRTEDYLFSPETGWIAPGIVTYPLKALQGIREVQFHQKERSEIIVRYSSLTHNRDVIKHDIKDLESGLLRLFGNKMRFRFEAVEDFERGPGGKFKWIVCELEEMLSK